MSDAFTPAVSTQVENESAQESQSAKVDLFGDNKIESNSVQEDQNTKVDLVGKNIMDEEELSPYIKSSSFDFPDNLGHNIGMATSGLFLLFGGVIFFIIICLMILTYYIVCKYYAPKRAPTCTSSYILSR